MEEVAITLDKHILVVCGTIFTDSFIRPVQIRINMETSNTNILPKPFTEKHNFCVGPVYLAIHLVR